MHIQTVREQRDKKFKEAFKTQPSFCLLLKEKSCNNCCPVGQVALGLKGHREQNGKLCPSMPCISGSSQHPELITPSHTSSLHATLQPALHSCAHLPSLLDCRQPKLELLSGLQLTATRCSLSHSGANPLSV